MFLKLLYTIVAVLIQLYNVYELENLKDRIALAQAINKMPPDWRKIVLLRYYRNMTQQQVADALGLSQVKISREEKKILAALREELA